MTETLLGVRNAALHGLGLDQGPLANAAANYVERPLRNAAQNYGILNPTAPRPLYLNDPSQRQASRSRLYLLNKQRENAAALAASRKATPSGVNKPTIEYASGLSPTTLNMQRRANVAAAAAENAAALAAMRAAAPSGYGTKKNYGLPAQKKLYNNNAQLQKYMKQRNSMCLTSCKMNILSKLDALIARKTKKNRSFRLQTAITA